MCEWPALGDWPWMKEEEGRNPGFYLLEEKAPRSNSDSDIMGLRFLEGVS